MRVSAAGSYDKDRELETNNPLNYVKLGQVYFYQTQVIDQLLSQAQSQEAEAETIDSYNQQKQSLLTRAAKEFTQALELKSDLLEVQLNLALVHEQQGQIEQTEKEMIALVKEHSLNVDLYFELGNFYLRNDQALAAEQAFLAAIQINPRHLGAHWTSAELYRLAGQNDIALREYQTVLQLDPDNQAAQKYVTELTVTE